MFGMGRDGPPLRRARALSLVRLLWRDLPETADETEARFIIRDHNG
jgi:hypothetical protein